jgi:hypothetical protein
MQTMVYASSLIRAGNDRPRLDQRELELSYSGPRHGLKDASRLGAALGGVLAYAGLLAYAWQ